MSLREEAIRAYQEKVAAKEAEQAAEKRKTIVKRIHEAQEHICEVFALAECPPLAVTQNAAEYWPEAAFEIDGVAFRYNLPRGRMELKAACPKCGHEWYNTVRIETDKNGARDLTDLGYELCALERHDCPSDKPPYVPTPPPQTGTYRHGGVEHNLLDSIREYVDDRIEERMGDR